MAGPGGGQGSRGRVRHLSIWYRGESVVFTLITDAGILTGYGTTGGKGDRMGDGHPQR